MPLRPDVYTHHLTFSSMFRMKSNSTLPALVNLQFQILRVTSLRTQRILCLENVRKWDLLSISCILVYVVKVSS